MRLRAAPPDVRLSSAGWFVSCVFVLAACCLFGNHNSSCLIACLLLFSRSLQCVFCRAISCFAWFCGCTDGVAQRRRRLYICSRQRAPHCRTPAAWRRHAGAGPPACAALTPRFRAQSLLAVHGDDAGMHCRVGGDGLARVVVDGEPICLRLLSAGASHAAAAVARACGEWEACAGHLRASLGALRGEAMARRAAGARSMCHRETQRTRDESVLVGLFV